MKTLLIATTNADKVQEIAAKLSDAGLSEITLRDLTAYPGYPPPEENGDTFAQNASVKALFAASYSGFPALADDSGLTVAALGGAPGVYSARYAGPRQDSAANNTKLLKELAQTPRTRRQAAFCCAIALALPDGCVWLSEAQVAGIILEAPRGNGGFGYDPLFYLPECDRSMAELTRAEKNRLSHRALALEKAIPLLRRL